MSSGNGSSIESEKYQVIRELGRGGMGVVYLAEDRQLRRQVALKVLYDYLNRDRAFVERFQEEACSVSTLHHPNIVCVHGLERSGDIVAIKVVDSNTGDGELDEEILDKARRMKFDQIEKGNVTVTYAFILDRQ